MRYSVGQPMGAYSSFAMLALTHHVIVHVASKRSGIHPKSLIYMVLGDDGAMANSKVAKSYVGLFSELGMEINPIKGYSGTVLEFAKQLWTINGINLSPIGPKNIMLALRHVEFLPSVLYEIWVKRFPLFKNFKKVFVKPVSWMDVSSKSVFKRTEEGLHQVCFISALSLFRLISSVHFQSGKKGKVVSFNLLPQEEKDRLVDITTKVKLRVLMAIGPISGLWYPEPRLVNPYRGRGIY